MWHHSNERRVPRKLFVVKVIASSMEMLCQILRSDTCVVFNVSVQIQHSPVSLIKSHNIWHVGEDFNVARVTAAVILAILVICFMSWAFIRAASRHCFWKFLTAFMKIARAAASTNDEKPLFSKEACLPLHLIATSHFKERTRLGQHCPVSVSFEFKGRVSMHEQDPQMLFYCSLRAFHS